MKKQSQCLRAVACVALVSSVVSLGCRATKDSDGPPPVDAPALQYGSRHFLGSVLSGPSPSQDLPDAREPDQAYSVRCRLTYYEALPTLDLPPLGTQARLIGAMRGEEAILANAAFTTRVRYSDDTRAQQTLDQLAQTTGDRSVVLHQFDGALFPETCVVFAATSEDSVPLAIDPQASRRIALLFSRSADGATDFGIVIDHLAKQDGDDALPVMPGTDEREFDPFTEESGGRVLQREFLMLESPPQLDGGFAMLIVPSPFEGHEHGGFTAVFDVVSAPQDGPALERHTAAAASCLANLEQEREIAKESMRRLEEAELDGRQIAEVLRSLDFGQVSRRALVFLTSTTGAFLAEDLALILDQSQLPVFAEAIMSGAELDESDPSARADLGWLLERGAYHYLIAKLVDETLSPSERGLLLKHTGEAGNFPAVLDEALLASRNANEFLERLADENLLFLDDHNVAARVRAYDWLEERGTAPADYDPLGPSDERRTALAAHEQELEQAEAATETRP